MPINKVQGRKVKAMKGVVNAIYITHVAGDDPVSVKSIRAVPGKGLEGDRYYYKKGYWSHRGDLPRDVTLIDTAILSRIEEEYQIEINPGEHRRNIETSGIALLDLIDKEFRIGPVKLKGIRVCQPCQHLVDLTGKKPLLKGLVDSGLVAEILTEGFISAGDQIWQV